MCRGHILLVTLTVNKLLEFSTKKNCKKTAEQESRAGKVIKRKDDKLYVKCKGYYNSLNSWIDKKYIVELES